MSMEVIALVKDQRPAVRVIKELVALFSITPSKDADLALEDV